MARLGWLILTIGCLAAPARADPPASQPSDPDSVSLENQPFDPAEKLFGDPWKIRSQLDKKGIDVDPLLIVDYTKVLTGGLSTSRESFRTRFDVPITIDTKPLLGLSGGTFYIDYQQEHGPQADINLVGDLQLVTNSTQSGPRSQIGQLWYQQKFLDDTLRLKFGKIDVNADFAALENTQEFLNNSFSTTPTLLQFFPSYPDNATGVALFYEPKNQFYIGGGMFDGSQARGRPIGKLGPKYFLDSDNNLFLIAEGGKRFKFYELPARVALGGWWNTNPLERLDAAGRQSGTGGVYAIWDQVIYQPEGKSVPSNVPQASITAAPEQQETPGGVVGTFSISWADPNVNLVDANAMAGFEWTGPIPHRPIDVLGFGGTWAHISADANPRHPYELAFETFYRCRFTRFVSLKPDLQYIIHPSGGGLPGEHARRDALVAGLRLEMSF